MITSGQRYRRTDPGAVRKPGSTLLGRVLILVAGAALIASCSSSGGTTASQSTSAGASSSFNQTAATAEVTQVWQSFFSKDTPISQKETLLQNGTGTMMPA